MTDEVVVDACVVGAGPAGASVALRLAALGHRVCIIDGADSPQPRAESVASSALPLLDSLSVLPAIERAGFVRSQRTRIRWAAHGESVQESPTLIVERTQFDRILLETAEASGATVLRRSRARRPMRAGDHWLVRVVTPDGTTNVRPRYLVDATGRRAIRGRLGSSSAALCGRWPKCAQAAAPEMIVEAGSCAWFWAAPLPDGTCSALVFLDTDRCAGLGRIGRQHLYRSLIGSSSLLASVWSGSLLGDVTLRDASCRLAAELIDGHSIRVGDAAFAMDPLSAQGIQAAIRSGVQGAAAVHTILSGGDAQAAEDFYNTAVRENAATHRRIVGRLYATQTRFESEFWFARSELGPQTDGSTLGIPRLDRTADFFVRLSPGTRLTPLAVLDGNVIGRRSALSNDSLDRPIAWLDGMEIGSLIASIGEGRLLSALVDDWSKLMPRQKARQMVAWLLHRGVLRSA